MSNLCSVCGYPACCDDECNAIRVRRFAAINASEHNTRPDPTTALRERVEAAERELAATRPALWQAQRELAATRPALWQAQRECDELNNYLNCERDTSERLRAALRWLLATQAQCDVCPRPATRCADVVCGMGLACDVHQPDAGADFSEAPAIRAALAALGDAGGVSDNLLAAVPIG